MKYHKSIKNTAIIILSHCDTNEKKSILNKNLETIRKTINCDIILTSHIPLEENIIEKVDYFVYDKSNPILKYPERVMIIWKKIQTDNGLVKISYCNNDYGWTVFNQMLRGLEVSLNGGYKRYIFLNYDVNINDSVKNELKYQFESTKYKVRFTTGSVSLGYGIIFIILNEKIIREYYNMVNYDFYLKDPLFAEEYFDRISKIIKFNESDIIIEDCIDYYNNSENTKKFSQSTNKNLDYFYSNFKDLETHYINTLLIYNIKDEQKFRINGDNVITLSNNKIFFDVISFEIWEEDRWVNLELMTKNRQLLEIE